MERKDEYEIALEYGHYIERDVYSKLLKWKKEDARDHKCLFLQGARRVGKSALALEFAHKEYKSFLKISFDSASEETKDLFRNSLEDLDGFYDQLSIRYNKKLYEGESLIILDEIQLFKPARQAIKTLLLDGRYDILETGSLASIVKKEENDEEYLLPSEEVRIEVNPITFKEYLQAAGRQDVSDYIAKCIAAKKSFGAAYQTIYRLFREYLLVGGMPKAVSTFLKTGSFAKAEKEEDGILALYADDFKRQKNVNPGYLTSIYNLIPSELSNHDKRFKLAHINKNARAREYGSAFDWLINADIINPCYNTSDPSPLPNLTKSGEDLKAYFIDTGLLYSLSFMRPEEDEQFLKSVVYDKLHVNEGMFMENYVAQVLRTKGYTDLFFYEKRDKNTRKTVMEIDFLMIRNRKITPIEVKSSLALHFGSLKKFKATFQARIGEGIVVYEGDVKKDDDFLCVPIFALDWYL